MQPIDPTEAINNWRQEQQFARLAEMQQYIIEHYGALIADERERYQFERHIIQLVHTVYREAQEPLVKQLTDFVMAYNRPLLMEVPK